MMVWMEYSLLVAVLLTLAAHGAEKVVRLNGRATRWVWLGALLLSFALPAVLPWLTRVLASDGAGLLIPSTTMTLALPPVVTSASPVFPWTRVVQVVWLAASALLLLYGVWSLWRLHRSRRSWEQAVVLKHDVLLSSDVGPAVVGVLDPVIVLPEWVRTLRDSEQALILAHESAHIAARDPWLMRLAQIAPVVMPWNVPLWLQSRRLRECVELDCDARLLAAGENADGYAELLLNVGERSTRVMLAAAMAEPRSLLERRIMRMFEKRPRKALVRVSAWSAVALIGLLAAFNAPLPARAALGKQTGEMQKKQTVGLPVLLKQKEQNAGSAIAQPVSQGPVVRRFQPPKLPMQRQDQLQQAPQQQQDPQPTFTPFTVAPALKNVAEVSKALEQVYPSMLRDNGIGGSVKIWFYIDEEGSVIHTRLKQSSGYPALDEAAAKVAQIMRFTPALNRDQRVRVWVDMPIVFRPGLTKNPDALLTPEQKARLDEMRREANQKMSEQAARDQEARRQQAAVTEQQGNSAETARPQVRALKEAELPALLNAEEVSRGLQRYYPPLLRDAGIGGEVQLWVLVDEEGLPIKLQVRKGSGHQALDDAALRVAQMMRFAPTLKDGKPISTWIELPISFRTQ